MFVIASTNGGLNMFFLSTSSDSCLHCVLLHSEHAILQISHTSLHHLHRTVTAICHELDCVQTKYLAGENYLVLPQWRKVEFN